MGYLIEMKSESNCRVRVGGRRVLWSEFSEAMDSFCASL